MRKTRSCKGAALNTGKSKCPLDLRKVKGALILPSGKKLNSNLTSELLEQMCHMEEPARLRPIFPFVEYAPSGGEVQVSAVGYGPNKATGVSPRTDVFTLDAFSCELASAVTKAMNTEYDVYYFDEANNIYGINDGTDELAGIPMSTIYHGGAPHPTSSAEATQTINFCLKDTRAAIEDFDFITVDFDITRFATGLVPVILAQVQGNKYKVIEAKGGYDRTEEFGELIASRPESALNGATAATYANGEITITSTGEPELARPYNLYEAGIKGIVGVKS